MNFTGINKIPISRANTGELLIVFPFEFVGFSLLFGQGQENRYATLLFFNSN